MIQFRQNIQQRELYTNRSGLTRELGITQWGHVGRRKGDSLWDGECGPNGDFGDSCLHTCEKFKSHRNVCFQQVSHAVPELAGCGVCL